jgi:hypothetical protein
MTTRALDYPLGRSVIPAAALRRWRGLPTGARPLVQAGADVQPDTVIAEAEGPQGVMPVFAGLAGRVLELSPIRGVLIDSVATVVSGVLGLGGSVAGPLAFLGRGESLAVVPIPRGAIIVYPQRLPLTLLQRAATGGAAGVVAASISALELEAFARIDLTAVLDGLVPGMERFPLPLLLTEGAGDAAMDPAVYQLLTQRASQPALLTGTTVPRWNIRPELLLPLPPGAQPVHVPVDSRLLPGARVRVAMGALRGARGELLHIFAHAQQGPEGIVVGAGLVRLDDGSSHTLPLMLLDRVE